MIKIKIMVAGCEKLGKTRLCDHLRTKKTPYKRYVPTVGVDLISYEHKRNIKYNIWDSSGSEVYTSVVQRFMDDANVLILLYSNETELMYAKTMHDYFINLNNDAPIVIVCTNKDNLNVGLKFAQYNNIDFKYLQFSERSLSDFWKNIHLMCEEKILNDNWLNARNLLLPYVQTRRYYWCFGWGR